jgi:hypothetical protein
MPAFVFARKLMRNVDFLVVSAMRWLLLLGITRTPTDKCGIPVIPIPIPIREELCNDKIKGKDFSKIKC